jgi:ankyrin repeat protein
VLDARSWSPLHAAAAAPDLAVPGLLEYLVQEGCDINAVTSGEEEAAPRAEELPQGCTTAGAVSVPLSATALHLAAFSGNAFAVERILRLKANAELQDHQGRLAMHIAVAVAAFDVVHRLLQGTADPRAQLLTRDATGTSPHALAVRNGATEVAAEMAQFLD